MAFVTNIVRKLKPFDGFCIIRTCHSAANTPTSPADDEFRVLDLRTLRPVETKTAQQTYIRPPPPPPREHIMPVDQDWPSVWPGPRTFHPASVPLPIRHGHDKNRKVPTQGKYANAEIMKLPNFLHLTPPAIERHCNALKKFCTPWPEGLQTEEEIEKHFPLEIITSDYCFSGPKLRDPKARVVTFRYPLSRIPLNKHAKDKMLRLLGDRIEDDRVTLAADRCPLRKQNHDYNMYLLLALYYESWNKADWESLKEEEDMEYYDWERNKSKKAYVTLKSWPKTVTESDVENYSIEDDEDGKRYREAVVNLFQNGENIENLFKYKEAVLKIVF